MPRYIPYQIFRVSNTSTKKGSSHLPLGRFFRCIGALATKDKGKESLDKAQAEFKEAIRLKPDFSSAHRLLGFVYMKQGRRNWPWQRQKRLRALTLNRTLRGTCWPHPVEPGPDSAELLQRRGHRPGDQGAKTNGSTRSGKVQVPLRVGKTLPHERHVRFGPFRVPSGPMLSPQADYHTQIGHALLDLGRYDEALTEFRQAQSRKRDDPYTLRLLAVTHFLRNAFGEAVKESEQYLKSQKGKSAPSAILWHYLALRHMGSTARRIKLSGILRNPTEIRPGLSISFSITWVLWTARAFSRGQPIGASRPRHASTSATMPS